MGSAKRAVRYLIRKKSKTVILFLVLLISEAMILSTGIILKASNEAKSELQKKTKTKILAGIMENNNPITTEDINKIQKLKGIDKINKNATLSAYPTNFQTVTENQNTNTENLQVRLVGYDDLKLDGAFAESEIRIVKGKYPKEKNEVVINQILAETNKLEIHNKETMSMDIIQECLAYFKNIDINFDLLIIADTQNKTTKNNNYIVHTDESEFFSRKEFAEIASTLFYIFGYAKVFYSELDFIKFVMDEHPSSTECYIYNFSRDGIAEGKKSLIPAFCDLCGLKYTGSNAFTISLLRNKWIFTQVLSNMGILTPKSVLYTFNNHNILEPFLDMTILLKNIHESASIGLLTDNKIYLTKENLKTVDMTLQRMNTKQLLIQEYISGLECEVLVIQFKGKYYALEPVEIVINGNDFLDSLTSNLYNYSFRKLSDRLSPIVIEQIKKQAVKAAQILSIKDYARFDFRIEKDQPYLIDIAGTPYTIKHSSVAFLFENIMHLDYKDIYKTIMACSFSNYDILQS